MATWYMNNIIEWHTKEETSVKEKTDFKQDYISTTYSRVRLLFFTGIFYTS